MLYKEPRTPATHCSLTQFQGAVKLLSWLWICTNSSNSIMDHLLIGNNFLGLSLTNYRMLFGYKQYVNKKCPTSFLGFIFYILYVLQNGKCSGDKEMHHMIGIETIPQCFVYLDEILIIPSLERFPREHKNHVPSKNTWDRLIALKLPSGLLLVNEAESWQVGG